MNIFMLRNGKVNLSTQYLKCQYFKKQIDRLIKVNVLKTFTRAQMLCFGPESVGALL